MQHAAHPPSRPKKKPFWKCLGPGLITGAADDDPSGIGTYASIGARYGYALLWLIPVCIPLMIGVQEMCGRIGRVTGQGLAGILRRHYPRWLLCALVALLACANLFNIYADLNVMGASAAMLLGGSGVAWLVGFAVFVAAAIILVPYRRYVQLLKWLCVSLLAYAVTALLPGVSVDWASVARHFFIPSWQWDFEFVMMIVATLGTTISPYLFFWQTSEEVEEMICEKIVAVPGHRDTSMGKHELGDMRMDTAAGMITSQLVCFFIITCAAATLNARGITNIETAQDAAQALLPLGTFAYTLFTLGIVGTGLLAIPTLAGSTAYAVAETFGWRYGLYRPFKEARAFYICIAGGIFIGCALNFLETLSPVKALVASAVLNGIVTLPMLAVLLIICNKRAVLGSHVNGKLSNSIGAVAFLVMAAAVLSLICALLMEHL